MNHAVDYGEWSASFDENVYDYCTDKFKAELSRLNLLLMDFRNMITDAMRKEKRPWICSEYHSILMMLC